MRLTARRVGWAEWALAIGALVVAMRSPVLFVRQRALGLGGGPIAPIWQDDALVRTAFIAAELAVLVVAARRLPWTAWRRQAVLAAFLAWCVASTVWSVEPSTTQLRSMMFVGTSVLGIYLGERFSLAQQLRATAAAVAASAVASLVAVVVVPDVGRATNGVDGLWSGVFVNRNLLGAVMAIGMVAAGLALPELKGRWRAAAGAAIALEGLLLWKSGTRTALVASAFAIGVIGLAALLRRGHARLPRWGGALAASGVIGVVLLAVHSQWDRVLELLGRDSSLTRRVVMWAVDRYFIEQRPNRGWGFEAIWTHPPAIEIATYNLGAYPYQAHNGYYELLLGVGRVGFALFLLFTAQVLWRAFTAAWTGTGLACLWPLAIATYALIGNFSEGFFVSNDIQWALFVAAGCAGATSVIGGGDAGAPRHTRGAQPPPPDPT